MIRRRFDIPRSAWIPALGWTAVVLFLSSDLGSAANTSRIIVPLLHFLLPHGSPETLALIHGLLRKAGHGGEYLVLGFLWFRALRERSAGWLSAAAWATLTAILVAMLDEGHQSFLRSRTGSLHDVGIDAIGAAVGSFGATLGFRRRTPRGVGAG